jgi:hypothetical protein
MARPEKRKARKDYPNEGIKAGDEYWYVKLKLQRGGKVMRSLKPFKDSQLTTSPFKSGWYSMQEAWEESDKDAEAIREAAGAIRDLGEEAQGSFDNMPEGLQQGDTGQTLENRATTCSEAADQLDTLADELEGLEEPVEPLGDLETDEENESAATEYEDAQAEHESEVERITDEADGLIGDMPE